MRQIRQDIRDHPWAAVLVVALCVVAWAFACAIRAQAGDEWALQGLLLTTLVLSLAAALVWLRRDIRAHPLAAALALGLYLNYRLGRPLLALMDLALI